MTTLMEADVIIVGTGPAGVSVAERLHSVCPTASLAMIERGPLLLRHHFYNSGASIQERDVFWNSHKECPWIGDLSAGGALLPALGGRSLVGGAQLHRFYEADLTTWKAGRWPITYESLAPYFVLAERQLLSATRSSGPAQDYAIEALSDFAASHPPYARDAHTEARSDGGYPHRSAVERLLSLEEQKRREGAGAIQVLTRTRAIRLIPNPGDPTLVARVHCRGMESPHAAIDLVGRLVVLAASPVESTRLVLLSDLEATKPTTTLGRFLAEHIYVHGLITATSGSPLADGSINVHIPPRGEAALARFQVEVRSMGASGGDNVVLRAMGSAAMEPVEDNRVELSFEHLDELDTPKARTVLRRSKQDRTRTDAMVKLLNAVTRRLGGKWIEPPTLAPTGASFHEAGTMRIGDSAVEARAADADGRLLGTSNVYVADAAAFPCVGVANPILTLTAMGYRLADRLAAILTNE